MGKRFNGIHILLVKMKGLKLFKLSATGVEELKGSFTPVEKSLQALLDSNLEPILGIKLLKAQFHTGHVHNGFIDSLGIDENCAPVIIEYKRAINENVVTQGLYYLDWLLDHKGDFRVLVQTTYGPELADSIDWPSVRLICIAGDYTRYDTHAVKRFGGNIELIRYRIYGNEMLTLECINIEGTKYGAKDGKTNKEVEKGKTAERQLESASVEVRSLFEQLKSFCLELGDDVQFKSLKAYLAFCRFRNFACVEVQQKSLLVYTAVDPAQIELIEGFTRDVRNIGHLGTGGLEIRINSLESLEHAKPLLLTAFEAS